jgi:hypothetical protein
LPNKEPHVIYKFENSTHTLTGRTYPKKKKLSIKIETGGSIKKEELANTHRQQTITTYKNISGKILVEVTNCDRP